MQSAHMRICWWLCFVFFIFLETAWVAHFMGNIIIIIMSCSSNSFCVGCAVWRKCFLGYPCALKSCHPSSHFILAISFLKKTGILRKTGVFSSLWMKKATMTMVTLVRLFFDITTSLFAPCLRTFFCFLSFFCYLISSQLHFFFWWYNKSFVGEKKNKAKLGE